MKEKGGCQGIEKIVKKPGQKGKGILLKTMVSSAYDDGGGKGEVSPEKNPGFVIFRAEDEYGKADSDTKKPYDQINDGKGGMGIKRHQAYSPFFFSQPERNAPLSFHPVLRNDELNIFRLLYFCSAETHLQAFVFDQTGRIQIGREIQTAVEQKITVEADSENEAAAENRRKKPDFSQSSSRKRRQMQKNVLPAALGVRAFIRRFPLCLLFLMIMQELEECQGGFNAGPGLICLPSHS